MPTDVKHPFQFVPANSESKDKIKKNLELCSDLYDFLMSLPSNRERSVAITKLEEVAMWGNKSIAFSQDGADCPNGCDSETYCESCSK